MKNSYDPVSTDEKPIAEYRVTNKGDGLMVYLYQSQIDQLWDLLQEQPDVLDTISEEYFFRNKNMEAARDRAIKHGFAYDPMLIKLSEKVGIGISYVSFSKFILKSLWEKMGLNKVQ